MFGQGSMGGLSALLAACGGDYILGRRGEGR